MIQEAFQKVFGSTPEAVVRAPGRVNLIGEHTDYNQGFVLPAAIDRFIWLAGRKGAGRTVRVHALDLSDAVEFSLDAIGRNDEHSWSNYLRGVSKLLEESGHRLQGADIILGGDVPREAGLSSSAAVEVGTVALWQKLIGFEMDPVAAVQLARRAESEFVGMPCGIMDQFIAALGRERHALFLDCRDLKYRYVPLKGDAKIVICNSGVKRALTHSEYEVRVKQCREAVEQFRKMGMQIDSLRDVKFGDLIMRGKGLEGVILKRATHVITENDRVREAVKMLEQGDLKYFGKLMYDSHKSLRDDYEVSSRELDLLVDLANAQRGVLGARMTGAGFGGCTVNLVEREAADAFAECVSEGYQKALGLKAEIYVCETSDGALSNLPSSR